MPDGSQQSVGSQPSPKLRRKTSSDKGTPPEKLASDKGTPTEDNVRANLQALRRHVEKYKRCQATSIFLEDLSPELQDFLSLEEQLPEMR